MPGKNNQYLLARRNFRRRRKYKNIGIWSGSLKIANTPYHLTTYYKQKKGDRYREFYVTSKNARKMLKETALYLALLYEAIIRDTKLEKAVHGFRPGKSVMSLAERHLNNKWTMELDISDFFDSIDISKLITSISYSSIGQDNIDFNRLSNKFDEVFAEQTGKSYYSSYDSLGRSICNLLAKDFRYLWTNNEEVEYGTTTEIPFTFFGWLNQGNPLSPIYSNIAFIPIDFALLRLVEKYGVVYGRYADNLFFSCDDKETLINLKDKIENILKDFEYKVNSRKYKIQGNTNRRVICGISVGKDELRPCKRLRNKLRGLKHKRPTHRSTKGLKRWCRYVNGFIKLQICEHLKFGGPFQ